MINQQLIDSGWDYAGYVAMLDDLLLKGKTTGTNQSESMLGYARLNQKRMRKWDKIAKLSPEILSAIAEVKTPMTWLILSEGWCGDAAQCLPFINKIASQSPAVSIKIILRDEHLELMDQYLTDGGRGIPKLIALDEGLNEVGVWGPRPRPMQQLMLENKQTQAKSYDELSEEMHLWYAKDRGKTLQEEFVKLLPQWVAKLK